MNENENMKNLRILQTYQKIEHKPKNKMKRSLVEIPEMVKRIRMVGEFLEGWKSNVIHLY